LLVFVLEELKDAIRKRLLDHWGKNILRLNFLAKSVLLKRSVFTGGKRKLMKVLVQSFGKTILESLILMVY
jgi:hypothetical protein